MKLSAAKTVYFQSFILGIWHYIVASQIENQLKGSLYDDWNSSKDKGSKARHSFKLAIQDVTPGDGSETATAEETSDDIEVVTDAEEVSEEDIENNEGEEAGNSDNSQDSSPQFEYEEEKNENGKTINQTLFYNAGNGVQPEPPMTGSGFLYGNDQGFPYQ